MEERDFMSGAVDGRFGSRAEDILESDGPSSSVRERRRKREVTSSAEKLRVDGGSSEGSVGEERGERLKILS
jgi:hypothetical protein